MDWQFKVGVGVAIVFGLLPFVVKDMPNWITWPGITVGVLLIAWGLLPRHAEFSLFLTLIFVALIAGAAASAALIYDSLGNSRPLDALIDGSIFVEFRAMTPLPDTIPSTGYVNVLEIHPQTIAPASQDSLVVGTITGTPWSEIHWPRRKNQPQKAPSLGSSMEITSDAHMPLIDVNMPIRFARKDNGKDLTIEKILPIIRLNDGHANNLFLYIENMTPEGWGFSTGEFATARTPEDETRRKIKIRLPESPPFRFAVLHPFEPEQDSQGIQTK